MNFRIGKKRVCESVWYIGFFLNVFFLVYKLFFKVDLDICVIMRCFWLILTGCFIIELVVSVLLV